MEESILQTNNDGVSLLRAGNNKGAMVRLTRSLAIMKKCPLEGERQVRYRFLQSSQHTQTNTDPETSRRIPRYIFGSPIEVIACAQQEGTSRSTSFSETSFLTDTEGRTCKLLSIVLFNLSLAHHLWAQEVSEKIYHNVRDELSRSHEVCSALTKTLRLYELCHSTLIFSSSGLLCSDLPIAVVVKSNVGEVHKELDYQLGQNEQGLHLLNPHQYDRNKSAIACSEQLVQIFMFFTANGEAERLEDFSDILSNAMATLNGRVVFAPAA